MRTHQLTVVLYSLGWLCATLLVGQAWYIPQPMGTVHSCVDDWFTIQPEDQIVLGQVCSVASDSRGNVYVLHRGPVHVDPHRFEDLGNWQEVPIPVDPLIAFNSNGTVINQWGKGFFYLPHSLTIDHEDNVWVTDAQLCQVFKFNLLHLDPLDPSLKAAADPTLGYRLQSGTEYGHLDQASDVAVETNGDFFVADWNMRGSRLLKYNYLGHLMLEPLPRRTERLLPGVLSRPHSLAVLKDHWKVCTADLDNGRILCFHEGHGEYVQQIIHPEFGDRLVAISYSPVNDVIYAVNGGFNTVVRGFTLNAETGDILQIWGPADNTTYFHHAHDVAVSPAGDLLFVAEIGPNKVWRCQVDQSVPAGT